MLSLKTSTAPRWLAEVEEHLEELLLDHAHCEKKAAGTAMNLIFAYVDKVELVKPLSEIVNEELDHFRQVIDLLESRGIRFRRLKPSSYGARLNELVRKQEPGKAVDRLLVAALIEARSCERFALLKDRLARQRIGGFLPELVRIRSQASRHLRANGPAVRHGRRDTFPARRTFRRRGCNHRPGGRSAAYAQLKLPAAF